MPTQIENVYQSNFIDVTTISHIVPCVVLGNFFASIYATLAYMEKANLQVYVHTSSILKRMLDQNEKDFEIGFPENLKFLFFLTKKYWMNGDAGGLFEKQEPLVPFIFFREFQ